MIQHPVTSDYPPRSPKGFTIEKRQAVKANQATYFLDKLTILQYTPIELQALTLATLLKLVILLSGRSGEPYPPSRLLKACRALSIIFFSRMLFVHHKASDPDHSILHSNKGTPISSGNVVAEYCYVSDSSTYCSVSRRQHLG